MTRPVHAWCQIVSSNRDLLKLKNFDWHFFSKNVLLRLVMRAPNERFMEPGFKFVHSVTQYLHCFFQQISGLQLSYTSQFFSLCPTLDTSRVFSQYPHCLPVCVVFVHLSVDILLIVGQFYNIKKRNPQHSTTIHNNEISTFNIILYIYYCTYSVRLVFLTHQKITKILIGIFCRCILSLAHFVRIKMR